MNSRFAFAVLLATCACVATASESLVTNLVVRQRKPWSNVVDIDYVYTGSCPTSMTYTATWDGQTTPVDLVTLTSQGVNVEPGQVAFTWNPSAAGYGKADLKSFKVSIAPAKQDPRTYLVIDLENGGYSTLVDVPEGGWTDEYKKTKLVLKRLYAGTYRWGTSETEYRAAWSGGQSGAIGRGSTLHDVTYTSDYYFPIFELTRDQYSWIVNGRASGSDKANCPLEAFNTTYTDSRGVTLDDGTTAVCWPQTGHKVNSTSFVGKLRAITARAGQPALLADLPTTDQWQLPMCGGRNTFLPNGGTSDHPEEWQTLLDEICWTTSKGGWENPAGLKAPNDWGFYDFNVNWNPCLNWINASSTVDNTNPSYVDRGDRTDDIGPEYPTPFTNGDEATVKGKVFRVMCGQIARDSVKLGYSTTIFARVKVLEDRVGSYVVPRVVVNLKSLVTVE